MHSLNPTLAMKQFLLLAVVVCSLLSALAPVSAAGKGGKGGRMKKPQPTPVPEKVNASGAKIVTVSGDSITVEYSKTSTTYKMSHETLITVDGRRVRSSDLKPGMHTEVDASKINPTLLLSIKAHAIPKS